MNLFSRVRKPVVLAALVLTLMLSGAFLTSRSGGQAHALSAASASVQYSTYTTYYSNASHTQQVGSRYIDCTGRGTLYGTHTSYYTVEIIDTCCGTSPC